MQRFNSRMADHSLEARERYFKRYTTVVSVSAGSGVGSPYISHECPADSLRFAAIHFLIASCASFMRLYGSRWTATAASPPCVSVAYTSPAVSNVRVTSKPKSHSIGRARLCRVVVEKNVVAINPQAWPAANELPDLVQGRP